MPVNVGNTSTSTCMRQPDRHETFDINPTLDKAAPGPWTWRDVAGAGLQISATLPAGFKFEGTAREADGKTSFMVWTVREAITVQIADERWVQFSTGSWNEMQKANARLIAAAPDMLVALKELLAVAVPENTFTVAAIQHRLELARAAIAKASA